MKKILLPTDFSEHSRKAIAYALNIFGETVYPGEVEFILLAAHDVMARPTQTVPTYIYSFPILPEEIMVNIEKELKDVAAGFRKAYPDLQIRERVVLGRPVPSILEAALEETASLIVMGTKGLSGLDRMILGSVASGVVEKASCPVLAVPENAVLLKPPSVVLATDFQNLQDLNVLKPLRDIVKAINPQFLLLHIYSEKSRIPIDRDIMNRTLRSYFNTEYYSYYFMEHDDPIEGMEEFLNDYKEGILALVAKERNFLERLFHRSVTKQMLIHSDVPVFVLNPVDTVSEKERPKAEKAAS